MYVCVCLCYIRNYETDFDETYQKHLLTLFSGFRNGQWVINDNEAASRAPDERDDSTARC